MKGPWTCLEHFPRMMTRTRHLLVEVVCHRRQGSILCCRLDVGIIFVLASQGGECVEPPVVEAEDEY